MNNNDLASRADGSTKPRVEDELRDLVLNECREIVAGDGYHGHLRAYEFLRGVRFTVGVLKEVRLGYIERKRA